MGLSAPSSRELCLVVCLAMFAALSCGERPNGEFTAKECSDRDDNDGDSLIDCDDPDCWVVCSWSGSFEIGDAASGTPDASEGPDAAMRPPVGTTKPPPASDDDDAGAKPRDAGASSDDDDAGTPTLCECAPDETCVNGRCVTAASTSIEGRYALSVRSALVPLGMNAATCYDYSNAGCIAKLLPVCDCERPDPFVRIMLNGIELTQATTTPVRDTANPVWADAPSVTIDLKATDKLTFTVLDDDTLTEAVIFSCMPALSTLESGTDVLSCNPRAGTFTPPAGSNFIITVEVRKLPPDASVP